MTNPFRLAALMASAAIGLSAGHGASAEPTVPVQSPGGDACTVTSGAFKGAKGHFKNVNGHLYCVGPGIFVPCENSCKAGHLASPQIALPLSKRYAFTR